MPPIAEVLDYPLSQAEGVSENKVERKRISTRILLSCLCLELPWRTARWTSFFREAKGHILLLFLFWKHYKEQLVTEGLAFPLVSADFYFAPVSSGRAVSTGQGLAGIWLGAFDGFLWAFPRYLQVEINGSCLHLMIQGSGTTMSLSDAKITSRETKDKRCTRGRLWEVTSQEVDQGNTVSLWKPRKYLLFVFIIKGIICLTSIKNGSVWSLKIWICFFWKLFSSCLIPFFKCNIIFTCNFSAQIKVFSPLINVCYLGPEGLKKKSKALCYNTFCRKAVVEWRGKGSLW